MRNKEEMSEQEEKKKKRKQKARIKEKNQPNVKGKIRLSIYRK